MFLKTCDIKACIFDSYFSFLFSQENVTISEPNANNPNWTFLYTTGECILYKIPLKIVSSNLNKMSDFKHVDYGNHLTELQMGVVFNETADGHGDTSNLCIQLSYNKFHCWMNSTSWKIESETDYFGDTFVTKSMNRFVLIFLTNRVITPNIFQSL